MELPVWSRPGRVRLAVTAQMSELCG
eukprot:SAG11_NODE_17140_length_527_cov_0.964953_1_plen_25_part_10